MLDLFDKLYKYSREDLYNEVSGRLNNEEKTFIITANPETFMKAKKDNILKEAILQEGTLVVPDGIGIVKAANFLKYALKERIPGIEITQHLIKEAAKYNKSIYLFGASKVVIKHLVEKLNIQYPNLRIIGYTDGYVKAKDKVFNKILKLKPDIILIALGIPQQEKLIYKHYHKFNKGIFIGVGGSFDVISGVKKRAPLFWRKLNLEWLYRLLKEPKRIKRFIKGNILFIYEIFYLKTKNRN